MTANCGNPLGEYFDNSTILVVGYSNPALEGDIVLFSCSQLGFLLNGSNVSTCMGNGKWEPDPRVLECKGEFTFFLRRNFFSKVIIQLQLIQKIPYSLRNQSSQVTHHFMDQVNLKLVGIQSLLFTCVVTFRMHGYCYSYR